MEYTVLEDTFENISAYLGEPKHRLSLPSIFVLPGWMDAWWRAFGMGEELFLRTVKQNGLVIGVAPLILKGKTALFAGGSDVCDYLDFIVAPGKETLFGAVLLDYLAGEGVEKLDMRSLRPDSAVLAGLAGPARERGRALQCLHENVSLELALPSTWTTYLAALTKKQRHEVRRKLRRLQEAGEPRYFTITGREAVLEYIPLFLEMFAASRKDKAAFMDSAMEHFFRSVIEVTARLGWAGFGVLELDRQPAAMVLYFDYAGRIFLYNSAYDPRFASVSAGLLCKVLSIKDSIERGRQKYDFLKGGEEYKYRLGAREIPVFNCLVTLQQDPE